VLYGGREKGEKMKRCVLFGLIFFTLVFAQETGARYLIITHDNFYEAIQPLAQWKNRTGLRTKVVKLSEIGSSTSQIRNYIMIAYDTWETPPEFVLLVGAPNYLPFYYYNPGWHSYYSDNYYTNMDADVYNEILSGRLTVHNVTEAQTVVNKILSYEMTPDTSDPLWFTNACLIAREDYDYDDSIYWSDINYAKDLMRNHGYTTIDTLSRSGGDNATDVITAVNEGRGFVLYRGSGLNNWYSPFAVNPNQTQNGTKLPLVLSITCRTIGTSSTPAVAEGWLLTGTPSVPRGAAGYFATTTAISNGAYLRSAVCKGFFNALFQEGKRTFGEACEGGRMNVYNLYGSESEYRGFTTLGDPSMEIWTATPQPLEVSHDTQLSLDDDSLLVHVECNSTPLESALVCVLLDTLVYEYAYTTSEGSIVFNFDTLIPGYMQVTVTAHNKIPYLDSISVVSAYVEDGAPFKRVPFGTILVQPNPFSRETSIQYALSQDDQTTIEIYDGVGRRILQFRPDESAGSITWRGDDSYGNHLPAGVYFIRVSSAPTVKTVPVVLLR
jgi:hypothetical protein